MIELTEKRITALVWVLDNKNKGWNISEFQKQSKALGYGPAHSFVKELEKNGFIMKDKKTNEYRIAKASDLIRLLSLSRPFNSFKTVNYYSQDVFEKKLSRINNSKLSYAFSVFAGSELFRNYVKTDQVHAYVLEKDLKNWEKFLLSKGFLKAEKSQANLFLIPASNAALVKNAIKIKGFKVIQIPLLLSDLLSFGGLGEEQGSFLLEEWLNNRI
jgi:hypothetical protein